MAKDKRFFKDTETPSHRVTKIKKKYLRYS